MDKYNDPHRYDDIIDLPHPEPPRPRMSMQARAAQFAPFQALAGHVEMVQEAAREVAEAYEKNDGRM